MSTHSEFSGNSIPTSTTIPEQFWDQGALVVFWDCVSEFLDSMTSPWSAGCSSFRIVCRTAFDHHFLRANCIKSYYHFKFNR